MPVSTANLHFRLLLLVAGEISCCVTNHHGVVLVIQCVVRNLTVHLIDLLVLRSCSVHVSVFVL